MTRNFLIAFLLVTISTVSAQNVTPVVAGQYRQFTAEERWGWFIHSAAGPVSLAVGLVSAGLDTARNSPHEYGPHWEGFGRRYGSRIADRVIVSGIEAGVGSLWGEDPRYYRVSEKSAGKRVLNAVKMTVITHDRSGQEMPAYARFIAVPASAFASNAWRPESRNSNGDALNRVATSFVTRIAANAFSEFWPDIRRRVFHRRSGAALATGPDADAIR